MISSSSNGRDMICELKGLSVECVKKANISEALEERSEFAKKGKLSLVGAK